MDRYERPARRLRPGPWLAVLALVLVTAVVVSFNQRHSGDPMKVRRELRKF